STSTSPSSPPWPHRPVRATGSSRPTAGSSPSATPTSSARRGPSASTSPSSPPWPPPAVRATGWWRETAASSASATGPSSARRGPSASTSRSWPPCPVSAPWYPVGSQATELHRGGVPRVRGMAGGGPRVLRGLGGRQLQDLLAAPQGHLREGGPRSDGVPPRRAPAGVG